MYWYRLLKSNAMDFNLTNLFFILTLIIPGIISIKVYDLFVATDRTKIPATHYILDAMLFSILNNIVILPILLLFSDILNIYSIQSLEKFYLENKFNGFFLYIFIFIFVPIILPVILIGIRKQIPGLSPHKTAWDCFFSKKPACFILVHLKNGSFMGGLYSENSYVNAFPKSNDLYIEETWKINEDGTFVEKIAGTKGFYVCKEDYDYIEFFEFET